MAFCLHLELVYLFRYFLAIYAWTKSQYSYNWAQFLLSSTCDLGGKFEYIQDVHDS